MEILETLFAGPWGPLVIFGLRIIDVSMATLRMLLAVRGQRLLVPLIGFFEVMIWLVAAGSAIRYLDSPLHIVGYAGGFAMGSVVGLWVEEKLAFGLATVRVIARPRETRLAEILRASGHGATEFTAKGREGPVYVVLAVAHRAEVKNVIKVVDEWDPNAFVTVEETRSIHRGWLLQKRRK